MAEIVDFGLQQHKIKMDSRYFENVLSVVAGDTGRRLEVQLLDTNGMVQDTTGLSLRLNAEIAGKATYTDATLVDAATGKYQLDLSNGMFLAPGNWQFQWQITDSADKKLHSFAFTGNVGKNISEGGSQATNFYLNLEDLKKMQEDLINGTIDSSILETNITEKLTDLETQYAPKLTEVTAQLAQKATKDELQQISLAYKESYDTLALLQAAYPTGDVNNHVVLSDGMIYTYSNGWISTEVQANGTGIANGSVTYRKLSGDVINEIHKNHIELAPTFSTGYVAKDSTLANGQIGFNYSAPLFLKKGETIRVVTNGKTTSVSVISTCNSEGGNISAKVISKGDVIADYKYSSLEDTYVIISYAANDELYAEKYNDEVRLASEQLNLVGKIDSISPSFTEGFYILYTTGEKIPLSSFRYSELIEVHYGDVIQITTNTLGSTTVSALSKWTADGQFMNNIKSGSGVLETFSYTPSDEVEFLRVCGATLNRSPIEIVKKTPLDFELIERSPKFKPLDQNEEYLDLKITNDRYIRYDGLIATQSSYKYGEFELKAGQSVEITTNTLGPNVSALSKWDRDGNKIKNIKTGTGTLETFTYTAADAVELLRVCGRKTMTITVKLFYSVSNSLSSSSLKLQQAEVDDSYSLLFESVIGIGDSLTEADYGGGLGVKRQGYPYFLDRMTDWEVTNGGKSGATVTWWWENKAQTYDYTLYDLAIICLGTNAGLTDTLAQDTVGEDYLNYANTDTGNYCKIIEKILSDNPDCKIFLTNVFASSGNKAVTNSVIQQISVKYNNLPVIDINVEPFSDTLVPMLIHKNDLVHMGRVGYLEFAKHIYINILQHVANNRSKYNGNALAE